MPKNFSPILVRNPSSLQHVVNVHPKQPVLLRLDRSMYPDAEIVPSDGFITKSEVVNKEGITFCQIEQTIDASEWAQFSSCYLGNVWVGSKKESANLLLVLQGENQRKRNHLTVVNPQFADVRVRPHTIMEIVLFDEDHKDYDEWNWEWSSALDVDVESLGQDYMSLYMWTKIHDSKSVEGPDHPYARFPRMGTDVNPWTRQHHFWFRFNESLIPLLAEKNGTKHVGDFRFFGWPDRFMKHSTRPVEMNLSVYCDLSKKYTNAFETTLKLDKKASYNNYPIVIGRPSEKQTTYYGSQTGASSKWDYQKKPWPSVREVTLSLLPTKSIEEGCTTVSADPPPEIVNRTYVGANEDCDFEIIYPGWGHYTPSCSSLR